MAHIQGAKHPRKRTEHSVAAEAEQAKKRWSFSSNRSSALATTTAKPASARGLFVLLLYGVCFFSALCAHLNIMTYKHHPPYVHLLFLYSRPDEHATLHIAASAHKVFAYQPGAHSRATAREK